MHLCGGSCQCFLFLVFLASSLVAFHIHTTLILMPLTHPLPHFPAVTPACRPSVAAGTQDWAVQPRLPADTGGATTTGPEATPPPQLSVKTWGGGGGQLEGVGGFPRWGGLRATHYYHMHTSRGDVCLGRVWGSCWWLL